MQEEQLPENKSTHNGNALDSKGFIRDGLEYLKHLVSLDEDKADPLQTIKEIERGVVFRGTNVWILIFSILIASLGLNVNSTAVVIGAMLISPLLGPIMGVGMGVGINSLDLIKKSLINLATMMIISIVISAIYFALTPLPDAQSELLARTTPTIFDVAIAFFGGLAGIVAGSRSEKSNVIPGVAIATALMPPLCTAGYGLGTLQWNFFIGAFYLFFINSVFICLGTVLIVRYLKYPQKVFVDKKRKKKVQAYITMFVIITMLPSIYIAYGVVKESVFTRSAQQFVNTNFTFENTRIIHSSFKFGNRDSSSIDITLYGEPLSEEVIEFLQLRLPQFGLNKTKLMINQGGLVGNDAYLAKNFNETIKTGLLEDIYNQREVLIDSLTKEKNMLQQQISEYNFLGENPKEICEEIGIQYPGVVSFSLGKQIKGRINSPLVDTTVTALVKINNKAFRNKVTFEKWIKTRLKNKEIEIIYY